MELFNTRTPDKRHVNVLRQFKRITHLPRWSPGEPTLLSPGLPLLPPLQCVRLTKTYRCWMFLASSSLLNSGKEWNKEGRRSDYRCFIAATTAPKGIPQMPADSWFLDTWRETPTAVWALRCFLQERTDSTAGLGAVITRSGNRLMRAVCLNFRWAKKTAVWLRIWRINANPVITKVTIL